MMAESKQQGTEDDDDAHLDERGPILEVRTLARAPDVYDRYDSYHDHGSDGLLQRRNRNHSGEVFAESTRQGSDRTAGDHQEKTPAIKEGRKTAEAVANVAVEAAGFGICGGKLRIGERAEQGEGSSCNPNQEGQANGAVNLAKNGAGRPKNAGTNDRADEKKKKIAKAKCADEFGHEFTDARRRSDRRHHNRRLNAVNEDLEKSRGARA